MYKQLFGYRHMNYVEFFGGSYILAWCSLWLFWAVVSIAYIAFRLINRILRTIKVVIRGWPPAHLDADGDFLTNSRNVREE